ncbi:hypothetical protein I8751_02610 [Nostocaceae cyanobacterium CENA357]|uniref:Uncharacterized protein n=1 Tax=Atlanticothrix silvestris CENA357 TaxID=1725252 RepID=A0A8J7H6L9_9CYAN|nr:hypothetical protein [Atlanticothrix silvestris]MBH8551292.1 hypothetical protein [Atlanticothrix silvestris CENA357]
MDGACTPTNQERLRKTGLDTHVPLIRISLEGRGMGYPDRYDQEKLWNVYKAKLHLEEVLSLLDN